MNKNAMHCTLNYILRGQKQQKKKRIEGQNNNDKVETKDKEVEKEQKDQNKDKEEDMNNFQVQRQRRYQGRGRYNDQIVKQKVWNPKPTQAEKTNDEMINIGNKFEALKDAEKNTEGEIQQKRYQQIQRNGWSKHSKLKNRVEKKQQTMMQKKMWRERR